MTAHRDPISRRRVLGSVGAALGAATAGCTDGNGGGDGAEDGGMGDSDAGIDAAAVVSVGPEGLEIFDPEEVRIQTGETVRWEWLTDGHTVTPQETPEGATWQGVPEARNSGFVAEHTFDVVGSYQYQCSVHDDMVGVVHVQ